jgi:hypothetical protein
MIILDASAFERGVYIGKALASIAFAALCGFLLWKMMNKKK